MRYLQDLYDEKYGLKNEEIEYIQSITIKDIYQDLTDAVESVFVNQMALFFKNTSKNKLKMMMIVYTQIIYEQYDKIFLLKCIEKFSSIYGEHQNLYISHGHDSYSSIFATGMQRIQGSLGVIKKKIRESIKYADPKIIPTIVKKKVQIDDTFESHYFVHLGNKRESNC